jgi:hypothetical protein
MKRLHIRRIDTVAATAAARTARRGRQAIQQSVRWLGFWAAIFLPLVYLPVLGFGLGPEPGGVGLALLGCHLLALFAGHDHNRTNP